MYVARTLSYEDALFTLDSVPMREDMVHMYDVASVFWANLHRVFQHGAAKQFVPYKNWDDAVRRGDMISSSFEYSEKGEHHLVYLKPINPPKNMNNSHTVPSPPQPDADGEQPEGMDAAAVARRRRARNLKSPWSLAMRMLYGFHQRFFRGMLIASKVPFLVDSVMQAVAGGQCAVIGLQSTGEARTAAAVEEAGTDVLDDFLSGPEELLKKLIRDYAPMPPVPVYMRHEVRKFLEEMGAGEEDDEEADPDFDQDEEEDEEGERRPRKAVKKGAAAKKKQECVSFCDFRNCRNISRAHHCLFIE